MNTFHVYAIVNRSTFDAYVGCTTRIETRWAEHQRRLTLGRHSSPLLQAAWEQHGKTAFRFVTLGSLVDVANATAKRSELAWINKIGTYNEWQADIENQKFVMREAARLLLGARNRARTQSPEHRRNIGEHTKRRWADPELRKALMNAPNRGKSQFPGMASRRSGEKNAEHSARLKALWADPEKRTALEARRKARWTDPEAKARQAEKMRAYHAARRASRHSGV